MNRNLIQGLYVIADTELLTTGSLVSAVEQALRGGAAVVQYRNKRPMTAARYQEAIALRALCRRAAVPLIINDDPDLTRELDADGVHIGREDGAITAVRGRLAGGMLIGASCYNDLRMALAARDAGADYVAFGSFFESVTKPGAVSAAPGLLQSARRMLDLPLVAIGGITPENGTTLLDAGADALAVIHGVFGQPDPESAARRYSQLWGAYDDAIS